MRATELIPKRWKINPSCDSSCCVGVGGQKLVPPRSPKPSVRRRLPQKGVALLFSRHIHEQSPCSLKFAATAHRIPKPRKCASIKRWQFRSWDDAIFWTRVSKNTHFIFTALQMKCTFIYHHSSSYHGERARLERSSFPHQLQFSKDLAAFDSGGRIDPLKVSFDLCLAFSRAKNRF